MVSSECVNRVVGFDDTVSGLGDGVLASELSVTVLVLCCPSSVEILEILDPFDDGWKVGVAVPDSVLITLLDLFTVVNTSVGSSNESAGAVFVTSLVAVLSVIEILTSAADD